MRLSKRKRNSKQANSNSHRRTVHRTNAIIQPHLAAPARGNALPSSRCRQIRPKFDGIAFFNFKRSLFYKKSHVLKNNLLHTQFHLHPVSLKGSFNWGIQWSLDGYRYKVTIYSPTTTTIIILIWQICCNFLGPMLWKYYKW